jgi:hypothetical protein
MFFGGITTATPLEAREATVVQAPGVDVSQLKLPVPIPASGSEGKVTAPLPGGSTTSPNSAFHALAGTIPDSIIVCSELGCTGRCLGYTLSSLRPDVCYAAGEPFVSFSIYQTSNAGLPYGVFVGQGGCTAITQIPRVNTCYYSPGSGGSARTLSTFFRN